MPIYNFLDKALKPERIHEGEGLCPTPTSFRGMPSRRPSAS